MTHLQKLLKGRSIFIHGLFHIVVTMNESLKWWKNKKNSSDKECATEKKERRIYTILELPWVMTRRKMMNELKNRRNNDKTGLEKKLSENCLEFDNCLLCTSSFYFITSGKIFGYKNLIWGIFPNL